jgi:hypothetical protein
MRLVRRHGVFGEREGLIDDRWIRGVRESSLGAWRRRGRKKAREECKMY